MILLLLSQNVKTDLASCLAEFSHSSTVCGDKDNEDIEFINPSAYCTYLE